MPDKTQLKLSTDVSRLVQVKVPTFEELEDITTDEGVTGVGVLSTIDDIENGAGYAPIITKQLEKY